jgi:hypothetical protein
MAQFRFTRDKQCERCGELDDGACACTEAVVHPVPQGPPAVRSERREFLLRPALETDTWPWEI